MISKTAHLGFVLGFSLAVGAQALCNKYTSLKNQAISDWDEYMDDPEFVALVKDLRDGTLTD